MTSGRIAKFVFPSGARPLAGFTLKRGIGRGGFGEVYYAVSDAGKDVALKLIQRSHDVELRGVRHCLNFRHPHLVEIYDIRESESGDWWIVMEYVAGENLQACLEKSPQGFTTEESLAWIRGATQGVAGLHERGVVHRDLKPGNIFRADGIVKIGDYGLSKFISSSRRSAQTESIGTIHYMAPEVACGRYGKEIDVYALGVIMYEMLAGKLPFEGESLAEILMKHLSATPDLSPLPANVRAVIGKCLAKDPKHRYPGALELADALERALAGDAAAAAADANRPAPAFGGMAGMATPHGHKGFESTIGPPKPAGQAAAMNAFANGVRPAPGIPRPAAQVAGAYPALPMNSPAAAQPEYDEIEDQPWPETPREPLWSAMAAKWEKLDDAPLLKAGVIAAVGLTLMMFAWFWFLAAWIYIAYYAAWSAVAWTVYASEIASRSAAEALAKNAGRKVRRPLGVVRPAWQSRAADPRKNGFDPRSGRSVLALPKKSSVRWIGELSVSCVTASIISVAITTAWAALMWKQSDQWPALEHMAAVAMIGAAASWTVMTVSKMWEGQNEDPWYRRVMLGASGLAVGVFAYAVEMGLMIGAPLDAAPTTAVSLMHGQWSLFGLSEGGPSLLSSMAFFGCFFALIKWWNQADPLRTSRFSLWRILGAAFWGVALTWVWPFPEPWGVLWAVMIAISVQASSPWQIGSAKELPLNEPAAV